MKADGAGKTGALLCVSSRRVGKAAVNTRALQTLREVRGRRAVATAFGVRVASAPLSDGRGIQRKDAKAQGKLESFFAPPRRPIAHWRSWGRALNSERNEVVNTILLTDP